MGQLVQGKFNTKFNVCSAIRTILLNDDNVKALVNNRIYPIVAPEKTQGNFIIYQRDSYSLKKTHMNIYEQSCSVFITCVSNSYDESQLMADSVYKALQGLYCYKDEDTGVVINSIDLTDSTEDAVNDKYIQVLYFNIN